MKIHIYLESHRKKPFLSDFTSSHTDPFCHKEIANDTSQAGSHYIRSNDKIMKFSWFRWGQVNARSSKWMSKTGTLPKIPSVIYSAIWRHGRLSENAIRVQTMNRNKILPARASSLE